jgi:hypothetical protein
VVPERAGREERVPTVGADESMGGGTNGAVIVYIGLLVVWYGMLKDKRRDGIWKITRLDP